MNIPPNTVALALEGLADANDLHAAGLGGTHHDTSSQTLRFAARLFRSGDYRQLLPEFLFHITEPPQLALTDGRSIPTP